MTYAAIISRFYGEGKVVIASDYPLKSANLKLWDNLIRWVANKQKKDLVHMTMISFTDDNKKTIFNMLNSIHNLTIHEVSSSNLTSLDIFKHDMIYFHGIPETVDDQFKIQIADYVNSGHGIIISPPFLDNSVIPIISNIDGIVTESKNIPSYQKANWTTKGQQHNIYTDDPRIFIRSSLPVSNLNSNWEVLMSSAASDIVDGDEYNYTTNATVGAEFGFNFSVSLNKGITKKSDETSYIHKNEYVYSATQIDSVVGMFKSPIIYGPENFYKWNKLTISKGNSELNENIYVVVKSSDNPSDISNLPWQLWILDSEGTIQSLQGKYLQFMIVVKSTGGLSESSESSSENIPLIESINISYFSRDNVVRFFTKAFDIKSVPDYILLTYNADNDNNNIKFYIAGEDTGDYSKYQLVRKNKIERISELPRDSKKIKFMAEIMGTSDVAVVLHEFSTVFSGPPMQELNKKGIIELESSSSEEDLSDLGIGTMVINETFYVDIGNL
jgi:hypothetical protein